MINREIESGLWEGGGGGKEDQVLPPQNKLEQRTGNGTVQSQSYKQSISVANNSVRMRSNCIAILLGASLSWQTVILRNYFKTKPLFLLWVGLFGLFYEMKDQKRLPQAIP